MLSISYEGRGVPFLAAFVGSGIKGVSPSLLLKHMCVLARNSYGTYVRTCRHLVSRAGSMREVRREDVYPLHAILCMLHVEVRLGS